MAKIETEYVTPEQYAQILAKYGGTGQDYEGALLQGQQYIERNGNGILEKELERVFGNMAKAEMYYEPDWTPPGSAAPTTSPDADLAAMEEMFDTGGSVFASEPEVEEGTTFTMLGGEETEVYDADGNLIDSHPMTEDEREHLGYLRISQTEAREQGVEDEWLKAHEVVREDAPIVVTSIYDDNTYDIDFTNEDEFRYFDSDDVDELISDLSSLKGKIESIADAYVTDKIYSIYDGLNEDTRTKTDPVYQSGINFEGLITKILNQWWEYAVGLHGNLTAAREKIREINATSPRDDNYNPSGIAPSNRGNKNSDGNGGNDTSEKVYTVLGTLIFNAVVPLYSELGKPAVLKSDLNKEYDVIGIIYHEGKPYYKIVDRKNQNVYFAEINNYSTLSTDYQQLYKSNITEMMLKDPTVGENVLAKMSDPNEAYFVKETTNGKGEAEGINFANVIDSTDGKDYYIPLSVDSSMMDIDSFISDASKNAASGNLG